MKKLTRLLLVGGFALMSVSSHSAFASFEDGPDGGRPPSLPEITVTGHPDSSPTPPPYSGGPSSGPPPSGPYRPSPLDPHNLDITTLSPQNQFAVLLCRQNAYQPACIAWYQVES